MADRKARGDPGLCFLPFVFDPVQHFTITFLAIGTRDGDIPVQGMILGLKG